MWIVHAGWTTVCEGIQYAIAGVFDKKGLADEAAMEFAESLECSDDDTITKNDMGVLITLEDDVYSSDGEIQVNVERLRLNEKTGHLFGQISGYSV